MATKIPLPEVTVDGDRIVEEAGKAINAVNEGKKATVDEVTARKKIIALAGDIWAEHAGKRSFLGMIRVKHDDLSVPVRIEYRLTKSSAIDISDEPKLEHHFGKDRPALFEKVEVVKDIIDVDALINILRKASLNPWDYLDVGIKSGKDEVVIAHANGIGVNKVQAFLPREGFLSHLNKLVHLFSDEAITYIKEYIGKAFNPTVVVGSATKKEG
jgi:hypothetical protein